MQAAGFKNCLANKAIFDAKLNGSEKIADQESCCSDYEHECGDENDNDEEQIVTQKEKKTRSSTMGGFVNMRSRKKTSDNGTTKSSQ